MQLTGTLMGFALLFTAGAAAAQEKPQRLPTSKELVPERAVSSSAQIAPPAQTPDNLLHLDLSTGGRVTIQLRPDIAPNHVDRIRTLARQGFYNGLTFHRVIPGFMAQGGDPEGTGSGGSPLPDVAAEFNVLPHVRGAVAMARASDVNSANSQFYIMLAPRLSLDNKYTVFGRVVSGMGFVAALEQGEPPANPSRILRASLAADNLPPPTAAEIAAAAQQQTAAEQQRQAAAAAALVAAPAPPAPAPAPAPEPAPDAAPAPDVAPAPEAGTDPAAAQTKIPEAEQQADPQPQAESDPQS